MIQSVVLSRKVLCEGVSLPEKNSRIEVKDEGLAIARIKYVGISRSI